MTTNVQSTAGAGREPALEANGSAAHAPPSEGKSPTFEELARDLVELEKQFPLPASTAILADAEWFDEHSGKPPLMQYGGSYVAGLNGAVVGHGPNALQLQLDVAKKLNVHPQRLIVEYIPRPTF